MGTDRSSGDLRGILIPDPRFSIDNVVSKTDATVPSTYTEGSPFSGKAVVSDGSPLKVRLSGTPTGDSQIDVLVQRSGGVGLEGAGYVWRDPDASSAYYGVDGPAALTGWYPLHWSTIASGTEIRPTVVRLLSGRLLCVIDVTSVGVVRVRRFDPSDDSWTNIDLAPTGAGTGFVTKAATACQLNSGRVLCFIASQNGRQIDMYYSDDDGDNWSPGGYRVVSDGLDEGPMTDLRCAVSSETSEIVLLATWANTTSGNDTCTQWASGDNGTQFTRVVADWDDDTSEPIGAVDVVAMAGGGFCVIYIDTTGANACYVRRIGSGFVEVTSAARSQITYTSPTRAAIWRDESDVLWATVNIGMFRSLDQGANWEEAAAGAGPMQAISGSKLHGAGSVAGRTLVLSRWSGGSSSYEGPSVAAYWFGGYSTHTVPVADLTGSVAAQDFQDIHYLAFAHRTTGQYGEAWVPTDTPSNDASWTTVGAGSDALTSSGESEVTTTAGQTRYFADSSSADGVSMFVEFAVEIDSGDGDTATSEIAVYVRWGDGSASQREVTVRMSSSAYQLYDPNGAANIGSSQALDFTSTKRVRVIVDSSGNVRSWFGAGDSHYRTWTAGPTGTTTDGGGAVGTLVHFGHLAAGANVSRWSMVAWSSWGYRWSTTQEDAIGASWSSPDDIKPQSFSPSPALLYDGVKMQAVSGPAWVGDTITITPRYEFPLSAAFVPSSPSPSRVWQATEDNAAYDFVIDLEAHGNFSDSSMESSTWGFFFLNSNLQAFNVYRWTGSTWAVLGGVHSYDGYNSLPFTRHGRVVTVASTKAGAYWSSHMQFAGDTIQIPTGSGSGSKLCRIVSNSGGAWRTDTKRVRLTLHAGDLDGTEDASGNCTIRRRDFGFVTHNVAHTPRYLKFSLSAQEVHGDAYRIGQIVAGPVFVFGKQYGVGWSWERASNTELRTTEAGHRFSRVRGALRRAAEVSWSDQAVDTSAMWGADPSPDYVTGITGGDPVASIVDTPYQVLGMTERTDGSHTPVILLPRIQRGVGGDLEYRQPQEFLYSRIVTQSPSIDHVVGDDASSAVLRLNRLRFEEEI